MVVELSTGTIWEVPKIYWKSIPGCWTNHRNGMGLHCRRVGEWDYQITADRGPQCTTACTRRERAAELVQRAPSQKSLIVLWFVNLIYIKRIYTYTQIIPCQAKILPLTVDDRTHQVSAEEGSWILHLPPDSSGSYLEVRCKTTVIKMLQQLASHKAKHSVDLVSQLITATAYRLQRVTSSFNNNNIFV